MSTMDDWLDAAAQELGLDAAELDRARVLDLARDVAHNVARPAAPLTAYLLGLATGRGADDAHAAQRLSTMAVRWHDEDAGRPARTGSDAG